MGGTTVIDAQHAKGPVPADVGTGKPAPARQPGSLADRAYREIEERIVTLALAPGEVLSEAGLSSALDIGRTPVREALQRLAREGLVVVLARRGLFVAEFNVQSQLRLLEVRREVERLMARSAASRASSSEREQFETTATRIRGAAAAGDDIEFMRLDRTFNALVASAARNEFADKTIALMAGHCRRFWFMHNRHVDDLDATAEAHAQVAAAIAAGDDERAALASDRLLDHIEAITRLAVDW